MNGKELMVDTNVIIYLLNGDKTIGEILRGKQLYVSFITEMELIGFKGLSAKEEDRIKSFLNECKIIELTGKIKNVYRDIRKKYSLKLADSIIVATAISSDLTLLSADKQLRNIKELDILIYNI